MCTCVLRVNVCVCVYVHVQSAFVFRVPGMMSVKASKQSLCIEQGAQQRLLREKPVRDAGKRQSSPQSSVPCAPEHLSIDHYWHLQGDGSPSSAGFSVEGCRKGKLYSWCEGLAFLFLQLPETVIPGMNGENRAVIQSKWIICCYILVSSEKKEHEIFSVWPASRSIGVRLTSQCQSCFRRFFVLQKTVPIDGRHVFLW